MNNLNVSTPKKPQDFKQLILNKFILFIFIPILLLIFISIILLQFTHQKTLTTSLKEYSILQQQKIYDYFNDKFSHLSFIANQESNINFLENLSKELNKYGNNLEIFSLKNSNHPKYDANIDNYLKSNKLYDFYLIDKKGNVLYSAKKENDFSSNLFSGRFANSNFGRAVQTSLLESRPLLSNLELYLPSNYLPSIFLTQPIYDKKDNVIGLAAIQIDIEDITSEVFTANDSKLFFSYIKTKNFVLKANSNLADFGLPNKNKMLQNIGIFKSSENFPKNYNKKNTIVTNLDLLKKYGAEWNLVTSLKPNIIYNSTYIFFIMLLILISILFLLLLIYRKMLSSIVSPINLLSKWTNMISEGKFIIQEFSNHSLEFDLISKNLKTLITRLKYITRIIHDSINDNKMNKLELVSEKDELGISINNLLDLIQENNQKTNNQNWVKSGLVELNKLLTGNKKINELADDIISHLVSYINAQIGAIYLTEKDANENEFLLLKSSFAFLDRHGNYNKYAMGEGIIGQTALEKKMMIFSNYDNDEPKINIGVEEQKTKNFITLPIIKEEDLLGVIQIGSLNNFSNLQIEFLSSSLEYIASAVSSSLANTRMAELLEQTVQQAEEMKVQQEELKQTNEEMKVQQEELRQNNEEMKVQQEELRQNNEEMKSQQEQLKQNNEELSQQALSLEKQKEETLRKNKELEAIKNNLLQKTTELELSNKYKSEFLANMSHELRTPLNSIIVLSQLLLENSNLTEKQQEFAKTIHSSGSDLLNLINDILDISKIESGKIEFVSERIDFDELSDKLIRMFMTTAESKNIEFKINIDEELKNKEFHSDSQRLRQILINLISNAFKFTEKGYIYLDLKYSSFDKKIESDAVKLIVKDTGIGIPNDKKDIIFESFRQADGSTSRKYGGTGLGLSIVKSIVNGLGGYIHLNSKVGEGSEFIVVIPSSKTKDDEFLIENNKRDNGNNLAEKNSISKKEVKNNISQFSHIIPDDRDKINSDESSILIFTKESQLAKELCSLTHKNKFKCIITDDIENADQLIEYFNPNGIILDKKLFSDDFSQLEKFMKNIDSEKIPIHILKTSQTKDDITKTSAIFFDEFKKNTYLAHVVNNLENQPIQDVLIIEDNDNLRFGLQELLSSLKFNVISTGDGNSAIELIKKNRFRIIILDLGLSDMEGLQLLKSLREKKLAQDVPVIIYTARKLSKEDEVEINRYAQSIIIKNALSSERLIEETKLFLHKMRDDTTSNLKDDVYNLISETPEVQIDQKKNFLKNKKILIIDDDVRNLFTLTNLLESQDATVISAVDGKDGLKKFNRYKDLDCIIMDIMMPELDGFEAIKIIRQSKSKDELPIIVLTAKSMKTDKDKSIQAGANDYLSKPINSEKLFSLLKIWLNLQ